MSLSRILPSGAGIGDVLTSTQITNIDINAAAGLDRRSGQTDELQSVVTASNGGRLVPSVLDGVDSDHTYDFDAQIVEVASGALSANRTYTVDSSGSVSNDRVRIANYSTAHIVTVKNTSGTTLAVLGGPSAEATWAEFEWTGSAVICTQIGRPELLSPLHGGTGVAADGAVSGIPKITSGVGSVVTAPAGALVGTSDTQTLASKTLTAPEFTGAISITDFEGTTTTSSSGKVIVFEWAGDVVTTDATETVLTTATLAGNAVHSIDVIVNAIQSNFSQAAVYKRSFTGRLASGSWTSLSSVDNSKTLEDDTDWDCTIDVSSSTCTVTVTGKSGDTIRWGGSVRIQSTVY